jgi:hypothetical protein
MRRLSHRKRRDEKVNILSREPPPLQTSLYFFPSTFSAHYYYFLFFFISRSLARGDGKWVAVGVGLDSAGWLSE